MNRETRWNAGKKKRGKYEDTFKSTWLIIKFCLKGDGTEACFKFQTLNEANAICDYFEKAVKSLDVSDRMARGNWRIEWRICSKLQFREDQAFLT